jgi:hypothetical protein
MQLRVTKLGAVHFTLVTIIAIVHALALSFNWYFYVWFLDIPVHFIAGAWVALFVWWIVRDCLHHTVLGAQEIVFLLISALFVGMAWEVFEVYAGLIGTLRHDFMDSCKDVVVDMLGALGAVYCIWKSYPQARRDNTI